MERARPAVISGSGSPMSPIARVLAVTPVPATSNARVRVKAIPPPLPALYGATPIATPAVPAPEEMVMMRAFWCRYAVFYSCGHLLEPGSLRGGWPKMGLATLHLGTLASPFVAETSYNYP